jgi:hypothetical protein
MPLLDIFLTMIWFFLFLAWIWLLIAIFGDIFRSEMSGWAKAAWTVFVFVLPLFGVLIYLIAHGGDMQHRSMRQAAALEEAQRDYIRNIAQPSVSTADELTKLADLRTAGVITTDEFEAQKARLLSATQDTARTGG